MSQVTDAQSQPPPPQGVVQVERNTKEKFVTVAPAVSAQPVAETSEQCELCGQTSLTSEWDRNDGDCPHCDSAGILSDPPEDEAISPLGRLLASLGKNGGGRGEERLSFYIVRQPDPPGSKYIDACPTGRTIGAMPFDDSLVSQEAVESAVQALYGGGKYQIKIMVNNLSRTSWTTLPPLADPARETTVHEAEVMPAPVSSARAQLSETLDVLKDILAITNKARPAAELPAGYAAPAPPPSMAEQITGIANVMTALKSLTGDGGNGGSRRSTAAEVADGITTGVERLANSFGVPQIMAAAAPFMVNAIFESRRAAAQKTAEEQATKNGQPAPTPQSAQPAASIAPTPPGVMGVPVNAPLPALSMPLAEPLELKPPGAPAPSPHSPADVVALQTALAIVVEQMRAYDEIDTDEGEEQQNEMIWTAADALEKVPREVMAPIGMLYLSDGASAVISAIAAERPDWRDLGNLESGITFVKTLIAELQSRETAGGGRQETDLGELEQLLQSRNNVLAETAEVGSKGEIPEANGSTPLSASPQAQGSLAVAGKPEGVAILESGGGAPVPGLSVGAASAAKGDAPPVLTSAPAVRSVPPAVAGGSATRKRKAK